MIFGSGSQSDALAENRNVLCVSENEEALEVVQSGMMPALPCPMHDDMQPVRTPAPDGSNKEE
jgi:hypothetical protein